MKLKELTIHNIASIEDAVIDFSGDTLIDQEMFLISGPTGAGKTTILDAVCIVLFEKTPRIENTQPKQNINFVPDEDNDTMNDMKSILHLVRKNAVEAYIKLTFEGIDGRVYTATWRVYRKGQYRERNKTVTVDGEQKTIRETYEAKPFQKLTLEEKLSRGLNKEWTLTDDEGNDTIKDVKNAIIEVIGMNFDQFCKTTMLAQGDFTKFLESSAEEKAVILEKMVKSEEYAKVGKVINTTTNNLRNEVEWRSKELQNFKFLTDEERQAKIDEIAEIKANIQQTGAAITAIDKKLQWLRDMDRATAAELKAKGQLSIANEKHESDETRQQRQTISLWDSTEDVRTAMADKSKSENAINRLRTDESRLAVRYERAVSGLAYLCSSRDSIARANEEITKYIDSQAKYDSMYNEAANIISAHNDISKDERYIAEAGPIVEEQDKILAKLRSEQEALTSQHESAAAEIRQLEQQQQGLKTRLKDNGADTIDQEIKDLIEHKALVAKVEGAYNVWKESAADYEAKNTALNDAEILVKESTENESRLHKLYDQAKAAADDSRNAYERTKAALSDHAKALRAELRAGDTCPVCGNRIDEVVNEQGFISALKPLSEKVEEDTLKAKALADEYAVAKATLSSAGKQAEKAKKDASAAKNKLDKNHKALADLCGSLWIDNYGDITESIKALKELEKQKDEAISQRQAAIKEIRSQIETVDTAIAKLRKERIKVIEDAMTKTQTEISTAENLRSEKAGGIAKARQSIAEKNQLLSRLINPDWQPSDQERYYEELKECAQRYAKANSDLAGNKAKITTLESTIAMITRLREDIDSTFTLWRSRQQSLPTEVDNIEAVWTDLLREVQQLSTAINNNTEILERSQAIIDEYTANNSDIDINEVIALMDLPKTKITKLKEGLQKLSEQLSKAKALHEAAQKSIADLGNSPLEEGESRESLSETATDLNKQKDEMAQHIGALQNELDNDTKSRQTMSDKKDKLDAVRAEYAEWDQLNKYLGNTDGKNFRNVAQSFILADLLDKANAYLANITGRYSLFCNPGTLTIMLRDAYQGGAVRPTNTLSGGEGFIISLSLALGLSSMQNVALEVDTLFIDEGFGTLSPEYLDPVLDALKRLYHIYGRRVGIISHVELLKNRIPVIIDVSRQGSSRSKVEIRRV